MSRRIRVLPDAVANQIAAGEVVERPASVIKELVENALDAGASRVQIEMDGGGKQRIRVSDDGVGMGREDALLSLDRHATSKISEARDLAGVRTFGFRGEALPSIAAVSRLTLETREGTDEAGTSVRVEGGRIVAVLDFPRQPGTTVDVRNLFFNAPARRKFLKSAGAESRAVNEALITLALANPSVSFLLRSGNRVLLDLAPVKDLATRVADLWGVESAESLLTVSGETGGVTMRGLIQRPDSASPGFRRAFLFVNGRPFKDPSLLRAADRGYLTTLSRGQRPWVFLYFRVAGDSVDVNVHPTKLEVRFRDPAGIQELVESSVRETLGSSVSGATLDTELTPPRMVLREGEGPGGYQGKKDSAGVPGEGAAEPQMALFMAGHGPEDGGATASHQNGKVEVPTGPASPRPRLWQIHNTFILAETREGLLIIDQHSAHERVLFQRLINAFQADGQESQTLLFPLTLRLSGGELKQIGEVKGILSRAGFEVEEFGGDTVIVHSVPNPHPYFDAERCFREMIAELTEGSELVRSATNQHERIAKTFACKGAIKAGQPLDPEELGELFDALFATDLPFHDVHGRPTIVRLSRAELERKFGRH